MSYCINRICNVTCLWICSCAGCVNGHDPRTAEADISRNGKPLTIVVPTALVERARLSRWHLVCDPLLQPLDEFDFFSRAPLDLIEFLKQREPPFRVRHLHVGWISSADVALLSGLVDSTVPCAMVSKRYSSAELESERSTVGQESMFLIEGYICGVYPPDMNSGFLVASDRHKEVRAWLLSRDLLPNPGKESGERKRDRS
mgnify:CR=1 FL=1